MSTTPHFDVVDVETTAYAAMQRADEAFHVATQAQETATRLQAQVDALTLQVERTMNRPDLLTAGIWIVGLSPAARYVDMSDEEFRKARRACPIEGERAVGVLPAFPASALDAWKCVLSERSQQ